MKFASIKIAASIIAFAAVLPAHAAEQKGTLPPFDSSAPTIEVQSWSWGASNATVSRDSASGLATGKRQHNPYTLGRPLPVDGSVMVALSPLDAASGKAPVRGPKCVVGTHFPTVSLRGISAAWRLTNARITECAADSVSFNYQKIEWDK